MLQEVCATPNSRLEMLWWVSEGGCGWYRGVLRALSRWGAAASLGGGCDERVLGFGDPEDHSHTSTLWTATSLTGNVLSKVEANLMTASPMACLYAFCGDCGTERWPS